VVGAFQGFFVHVTSPATMLTAPPSPADGGPVYGVTTETPWLTALQLTPAAGNDLPAEVSSDVLVALGVDGSEPGVDLADAFALGPPAQSFVYLATTSSDASGGSALLAVDVRPAPTERLEIDLAVAAIHDGGPAGGPFTLMWPVPEGMPEGWSVSLFDRDLGVTVPMDAAGAYPFTLDAMPRSAGQDGRGARGALELPPTFVSTGGGARFAIVVEPDVITGQEPPPTAFAITSVRPNPVSRRGHLSLELPTATEVMVDVVDALGRRVALLWQGRHMAGRHEVPFDVSTLRPGTYVVRAISEGSVEIARLTVAR
jgi:hypothetical protein